MALELMKLDETDEVRPDDSRRPRMISAEDLVRRMKPFLVYN
jgi:hypothetical protein